MKEISLTNFNIAINQKLLSFYKDKLQLRLPEDLIQQENKTFYLLRKSDEYHFDDTTVVVVKYGIESRPPDKLIETDTLKEVPNQRQTNQLEPRIKIMIIEYQENRIYHNRVSKEFMKEYFRVKLDERKGLMDFSTTIDRKTFMESIDSVKQLSFTMADTNNLFTRKNMIYSRMMKDFFGYGMGTISVEMKMTDKQDKKKIKLLANKLFNDLGEGVTSEYEKIKIVGNDQLGLEKVFKIEKFSHKIKINVPDTDEYTKDEVENILTEFKKALQGR